MPIQIKRHLIVLILFIAIFIIFRMMMVPETFGDKGHYRANSLYDNELFEAVHAGEETCIMCHDVIGEFKQMDSHKNLACESCHGPGMAHTNEPDSIPMVIPEGREHCGLCHQKNAARPDNAVAQIELKEHNPDKSCTHCHNPHAPWELRNQDIPEEIF